MAEKKHRGCAHPAVDSTRAHIGAVIPREARAASMILAGIRRYLGQSPQRRLSIFRSIPSGQILADDVLSAGVDGVVLTSMPHHMIADFSTALAHQGIPWVQTLHNPVGTAAEVGADYSACADVAIEHFVSQNYHHIVFFSAGDVGYANRVWAGFERRRPSTAAVIECFTIGSRTRKRGVWRLQDQLKDLADLLRPLRQPVGVAAVDDTHAERAVRAAALAGKHVPEDVAIVGIGDDHVFCEYASTPLSSIALDYERMGVEALTLLDRLIDGGQPPHQPIWVPPLGVIARMSSDHTAVDDLEVESCIRFIRRNVDRDLRMDDLVALTSLSRSTITRRFVRTLGRSPTAEIMRLRMIHARKVLRDTTWTLARVAVECGFTHLSQFSRVFKRETGMTPIQYRRSLLK